MKKIMLALTVIIIAVASCTKKSAPTTVKEKTLDGAPIFANNCARCHGAQGVKDSRTPNLQTIDLGKGELVNSITFGKGHMPSFKDKLSTAEISAVADLIVGWHKK